MWQGAHGYFSILVIIPRYGNHCAWNGKAAWEENLNLRIQSIYAMAPWMFAYDEDNYAQYLTYYKVAMSKRVQSHPGLFTEFRQK